MAFLGSTKVIVVPDDDIDGSKYPPGILSMLGPNDILMSNDSLRMYVRQSQWDKMKDSFKLVNG
jgi:hypothetical protein